MNKVSGFYIVNDVDSPDEKMLVYLPKGATVGRYMDPKKHDDYRFTVEQLICDGTPVEAFGFEVKKRTADYLFVLDRVSGATYNDGTPRQWQGKVTFTTGLPLFHSEDMSVESQAVVSEALGDIGERLVKESQDFKRLQEEEGTAGLKVDEEDRVLAHGGVLPSKGIDVKVKLKVDATELHAVFEDIILSVGEFLPRFDPTAPDEAEAEAQDKEKKAIELVYIAGPYASDQGAYGIRRNVEEAAALAVKAMEAGFFVICPHTMTHDLDGGKLTEEFFLAQGLKLLEKCDAVLLVSGWKYSKGTQKEIQRGKELGIPVVPALEELIAIREERKVCVTIST